MRDFFAVNCSFSFSSFSSFSSKNQNVKKKQFLMHVKGKEKFVVVKELNNKKNLRIVYIRSDNV